MRSCATAEPAARVRKANAIVSRARVIAVRAIRLSPELLIGCGWEAGPRDRRGGMGTLCSQTVAAGFHLTRPNVCAVTMGRRDLTSCTREPHTRRASA